MTKGRSRITIILSMIIIMILMITNVVGEVKGQNMTESAIVKYQDETKVEVVKELPEERSENSNTYLLSNGEKRIDIYNKNIRYRDKNGKLIEYDSSLVEMDSAEKSYLSEIIKCDENKYIAVNKKGDSKQYFPQKLGENNSIVMNNDRYTIEFAPALTKNKLKSEINGKKVQYYDEKNTIEYQYTSLNNGVKEDIILKSRPKENEFKFKIKGNNVEFEIVKEYGGINLIDSELGNTVGYILPPNISDGNGNINYEDISYEIKKQNGETYLVLKVKDEYFENEKIAYPVKIDPTAIWFNDKLRTAMVCNMKYTADLNIPGDTLYIENKCRNSYMYMNTEERAYLDTGKVTSNEPFVGESDGIFGKQIEKAELVVTETTNQYSNGTSGIVEIRSPKEQWNVESITWNNQPDLGTEIWAQFDCKGIENTKHCIDLTEWAQKIANNEIVNNGLVFIAKEEGTGQAIYGPNIKYGVNDDGSLNPIYMSLSITYKESQEQLVKYDCVNNCQTEYTFNYTLRESGKEIGMVPETQMISTQTILPGGQLDLQSGEIYPYSSIVKLATWCENHSRMESYGTGFVIAPNVIATAGHCVWNGQKWVDNIKVYNNYDANFENGYNSEEIICSKNYVEEKNARNDWAIIKVDGNIGKQTGWLGFEVSNNLIGTNVTVAGVTTVDGINALYKSYGIVKRITNKEVAYDASTQGGQSGGPVFNDENEALAIHTMGGSYENSGTRIDSLLFEMMKKSKKESIEKYE